MALTDYGLLGIMVTALTTAVSYLARTSIARESSRSDRLEADLREVQDKFSDLVVKTISALAESSLTLRDATKLIERQQDRLDQERQPK